MLKSVTRRHRDALSEVGFAEFERLLADYYRGQGYAVDHCGTGALAARFDGGIDLKLRKGEEFILVQCKHWNAKQVTHNAVHELLGIMVNQGATGAIVVTSGEFTAAARKAGSGRGRVTLVDGIEVRRMLGEKLVLLAASSADSSITTVAIARAAWGSDQVEVRGRGPGRHRWGKREAPDVIMVKIVASLVMGLAVIFVLPALFASVFRSLAPRSVPPSTTQAVPVRARDAVPPPVSRRVDIAPSSIQRDVPPPPPTAQELAEAKAEQARRDAETQQVLQRIPEMTHYRYSPLDQNKDPPSQTGQ